MYLELLGCLADAPKCSQQMRLLPETPRGSQWFQKVPKGLHRLPRLPEAPKDSQRLPDRLPQTLRGSQRLPETLTGSQREAGGAPTHICKDLHLKTKHKTNAGNHKPFCLSSNTLPNCINSSDHLWIEESVFCLFRLFIKLCPVF
jgi:hypothetical protein